jgi:hypothetical protein
VSFDLLVDRFEGGQQIGGGTEVFREIFGPHEAMKDGSFRRFSFDDGAAADAYLGENGGCMFNHFGGEQFFGCLFQYLLETRSVAYWSSLECCAAVTDRRTLPELPPDMRERLRPVVVRSAAELMQAVLR